MCKATTLSFALKEVLKCDGNQLHSAMQKQACTLRFQQACLALIASQAPHLKIRTFLII
jgi:hypothetical protein